MHNIEFTRATGNDIQVLVDHRVDFLSEYWGPQSQEALKEFKYILTDYFSRCVINGTYICYLAKENNTVVGIGGMVIREQPGTFKNPSGRVGYLMNMYTIPSFRRKGICSRLLEHLVEAGKELGLTAFELHATKEGEHVYPLHGFILHDEPTYRKYLTEK